MMLVVCHEVFEVIPELRSVYRVCAQPAGGSIVIAYICARGTLPESLCGPDLAAIGSIAPVIKRSVALHVYSDDLGFDWINV